MQKLIILFIFFGYLNLNAQICLQPAISVLTDSAPRAIINADFNGDGKIDLAVANNLSDNVSVLLGTGGGTFGSPTNFSVGNHPISIITDDFNGDSKIDLAVANRYSQNISILLGLGTGSFSPCSNFSLSSDPLSVISSDFNLDGNADVALTTMGPVSILLGNGTGNFNVPSNILISGGSTSIISNDFNGDNIPDLATANRFSGDVAILLGIGTGSFMTATYYSAGVNTFGLTSADINGDSIIDLVVADWTSGNIDILLGIGTGSFNAATHWPLPGVRNPYDVTTDDLNGDGTIDIAVANLNTDSVTVLLNNGSGNFTPFNFADGEGGTSIISTDLNGDGKPDLAVTNEYSSDVSILMNCFTVNVPKEIELEYFNIYPNPSKDIFTLTFKHIMGTTKIFVYDLLGNCLWTKNCRNETSSKMDLSSQPKGIYVMEIVSEGEKVMKKIVLE